MKVTTVFLFVIAAVVLAGCGTTTGERTGSGALLGAGAGAAIGSLSGNAGKGALIGAGAGAVGGYLYDQNEKQQGQPYYEQDGTWQDQ
jgi:membrane associated rhomboid family serine protease